MTALIQRLVFQCSISFLIVKHDNLVVMNILNKILDKILDKIRVRNFGQKIAEGMHMQVKANEAVLAVLAVLAVVEAYLETSYGAPVAA